MAESDAPEEMLRGEQAFWRVDLSNALLLVSALLLGMYSVVRPVAFQWSAYSAESAMAGMLGLLFVLAAWGVGAVYVRRSGRLPDRVVAVLVLWVGLHLLGLLRSPYMGAAVPLAAEAGVDVALLLAGFAIARAWPGVVSAAVRLLVAAGVLEAMLGFWQKIHDLPLLRQVAARKSPEIEDILFTQQGQERLFSEEIFGTFGNANSFAGFLLITIFLQLGIFLDARKRTASGPAERLTFYLGHVLCLLIQCGGLYVSGSKGAWVAGLAGGWFLIAQLAATSTVRARVLGWLTGIGVAAVTTVLFLGAAGPLRALPFPASLQIRFDYWQTGWGIVCEQPWVGVGLGGFSEAFPYYKTPLTTETMLAHNDYLQLWAELGLLAPVTWLLLWFVVLRPRAAVAHAGDGPYANAGSDEARGPLSDEHFRTRALGFLMLAGGVLACVFMMTCFGRMHGSYLARFLSDLSSRDETRLGALAALTTPLCYVGAFLVLSRPRAAVVHPPGGYVWMGVRAGIGAILVHQMVDFDMTAQAIMAWLFLLGGFLLAQAPAEEKPGVLARVSRWVPPLLVAGLLWAAVLVPLFSGQARDNALEDEKILRTTRVELQGARLPEEKRRELLDNIHEVLGNMVRSRETSVAWAPFDGSATMDLSLAYLQVERSGEREWQPLGRRTLIPLKELIVEQMERTKRLRPRWHGAQLVAGHVYLEWGLAARKKGREQEAGACFRQAEADYRKAADLYPLNPSCWLVLGDALLFQGRIDEAAAAYRKAWEIDRRILDPNVRFASIFHDPLPGCLVKHGKDLDVQERLSAALSQGASDFGLEDRRGLLVRQILVAAWRLLGTPHGDPGSGIEQFMSRVGLIHACEALAEVSPEDGHAVLFHALALLRFHKPETGPRDQIIRAKWEWAPLAVVAPAGPAWSAAVGFALARERGRATEPVRRAVELQAASVRRGSPDTLPQVFENVRRRFGLPPAKASQAR